MIIPVVNIPVKGCIVIGDTVDEITVTLGGDFSDDLRTNHIIRMQVYQGNNAFIDIDSTGGNGITITGAKTFTINEVVQNNFPEGSFKGDLQIEKYEEFAFDPISVKTYFRVKYNTAKEYTKIE